MIYSFSQNMASNVMQITLNLYYLARVCKTELSGPDERFACIVTEWLIFIPSQALVNRGLTITRLTLTSGHTSKELNRRNSFVKVFILYNSSSS